MSSRLVTWTESGLIDQRLFKAASITAAEAVTGILPKDKQGPNSQSDLLAGAVAHLTFVYLLRKLKKKINEFQTASVKLVGCFFFACHKI